MSTPALDAGEYSRPAVTEPRISYRHDGGSDKESATMWIGSLHPHEMIKPGVLAFTELAAYVVVGNTGTPVLFPMVK